MSDIMEEKGVDDAQEQAAFGSGFDGNTEIATGKAAPVEDAPISPPADAPEYVQITRKDFDEFRAAASKTASYDQQLSKAFGTIGNLSKIVNGLQTQTPKGFKVEVPKESFAKLTKDFPELAEAVQEALSGIKGTGTDPAPVDDETFARRLSEAIEARELKALEEDHKDWRNVVGAVGADEKPDPEHPFRAWLATKDAAYQKRVNETLSAAVISREIDRFRAETKTASEPKPVDPKMQQRTDRIRAAVQPKGDGGAPAASNTREDAFAAGFGS